MGQSGMNQHCFAGDLQRSLGHDSFLNEIYKFAYPDVIWQTPIVNLELQKMGIDRQIGLANGRLLYFEEKIRSTFYPDFLLEYISNSTYKTPGWMEKDLKCDFLSYAFIPAKLCYLIPWHELQSVWFTFKALFLASYKTIEAINNGYCTWSVPVPIAILRSLIPSIIEIVL